MMLSMLTYYTMIFSKMTFSTITLLVMKLSKAADFQHSALVLYRVAPFTIKLSVIRLSVVAPSAAPLSIYYFFTNVFNKLLLKAGWSKVDRTLDGTSLPR